MQIAQTADQVQGQIDTVSFSAPQNQEYFWYASGAVLVALGVIYAFHHLKPDFKLPRFFRRPP